MAKDYIYYILTMKTPTQEFKEKGFKNFKEDIEAGVRIFNAQLKNEKELVLLDVEDSEIYLMLITEPKEDKQYTLKDLVIFSRIMYNTLNWNKYTREENTLFYSKRTEKLEISSAEEIICEFGLIPYDYMDEDDLESIEHEPIEIEEIDEEEGFFDYISDEQAIAVFNYLLKVQDIGDAYSIERKKHTINKIKKILEEWI
ncbi:hypothetical protein SAMN02745883_02383 [Caminicella sporogenes DSM 14501]|uniref:Uncharacterized protein n=1 Tax=Caminicella sporogenes DSM 14501 TaxID=1121266 RepID=A0A1M6TLK5_9FIRM|nr:hypothetical protein [Caminicella sporogenes]RKD22340.1 hypothetical protein BET04_04720 [Caminicella sporogenes]SHK57800.1 hypothetical protein SAMN02745883_02383 [Caminicella sporogenes DSM 14501]